MMELWHLWTGTLQQVLHVLAVDWGLGLGLAVMVLTLMIRTALLPVTWSIASRGAIRQGKIMRLELQLKTLREQYANDPQTLARKTLELYQQHGLSLADGKTLLGAAIQVPVISGLWQVLRDNIKVASFLWVRNLGIPDTLFAILAAVTTAVVMAVAPHMSEHMRLALILVPAVVCFVAALHFSSGIALYWITTNLFSTGQTLALRWRLSTVSIRPGRDA